MKVDKWRFSEGATTFKYLKDDKTILERYPPEALFKLKNWCFLHYDNWQCMDTIRDKILLEELVKTIFKLTYKFLLPG